MRHQALWLAWMAAWLFFGSYCGTAQAASDERLVALARDPRWLRLGHYQVRVGGGFKGRADSPHFFLSPQGKTDPLAELRATIAAMQAGQARIGGGQQAPHCAFPARRRFIEENLGLTFALGPCPDFEAWRDGLGAQRVTLVFSSYYTSNPASTFGHTFLRLDRSLTSQDQGFSRAAMDLLNYGVSFGAYVDTDNAIVYGIKGIFGGFHGFYFIDPYYMKVAEYALRENRDLWEYELSLSPDEVSWLVAHLWEQYGTNYFDYFFFDENCSYQLLALLEVARPAWHLLDDLPGFVLPVDTVRAVVAQAGAISEVRYLPSYRRRLYAALAALSPVQRRLFDDFVAGAPLDSTREIAVWDAYVLYLQARKMRLQTKWSSTEAARLQSVLQGRAHLGTAPEPDKLVGERPDRGHATHRAELGVKQGRHGGPGSPYVTATYGLHDFSDAPYGYASHMVVNFLGVTGRWDPEERQLRWDDALLLDIASLPPFHAFDPQLSWYFRTHFPDAMRQDCLACRDVDVDGGAGLTWGHDDAALLIYGLAKLGLRYHEGEGLAPWQALPGMRLGAVWRLSSSWRMVLDQLVHKPMDARRVMAWEGEARWELAYDLTRQTLLRYQVDMAGAEGAKGYALRHGLGLRWHF